MAISVTHDIITAARRAEYDHYQRARARGSGGFIPTLDPVIRAMLEAALNIVEEPETEPAPGEPPGKRPIIVKAHQPRRKR